MGGSTGRRELGAGALAALASAALPRAGAAQGSYPTKPVRLIVPFSPGATTDFLARIIAQNANGGWGQPVVVENRPGAGGQIGTDVVAKAPPDGYTVGLVTGSLSMYPALGGKVTFDSLEDFSFVSLVARVPNVLVVNAAHPARTLSELVSQAKRERGQTYASSGAGTNTHFTGEMLKLASGLDMEHVSYRGGAPAMADLVAGHVKIMMASLTTAVPHIRSGKIVPLAVSTAARSYAVPDVPTLKELGYPEIDTSEWWAVIAPRGTPEPVLALWRREVERVAADPTIKDKSPGIELLTSSSAELKALVSREIDSWKTVVQRARITME